MGAVLLDISMSLDGFVTGPHDSIEQPLGIGGERLHEWIFGGETDRSGTAPSTSARGSNREILDELFQVPCFVVPHRPRAKVTKGATRFTFVTEGIQSALDKAQAAAGDEIQIHLVPVILGEGGLLFERRASSGSNWKEPGSSSPPV